LTILCRPGGFAQPDPAFTHSHERAVTYADPDAHKDRARHLERVGARVLLAAAVILVVALALGML